MMIMLCVSAWSKQVTVGTMKMTYNDEAAPGDAVVVRLEAQEPGKKAAIADAAAELFQEAKRVEKTAFFKVPQALSKKEEYVTYIPLSTWLKEGEYRLRITVKPSNTASKTTPAAGESADYEEPVTITHKDFINETIPLDERNTSIKTDTSQARMNQIKRLNAILGTVTPQNVFTLSPFVPPVAADTRRSSHFGDRRVFKYTSGKSSTSEHFGIDYAVPTGTTVAACADGVVVMAEDRVSTGWSVAVEHAPGLYSLYYHMSELAVKEGQRVKTGEKLGLSGATGLATGPHLHWEVRLNMCAVSPDFWTGDYVMTGG